MIITQTPVRMSFAGGGSDLPAYYRRHSGAVVSTTIDKYVYVAVNRKFDDAIRVSYSKTEEVESASELEHSLVREALRMMHVNGGIEITSIADIPSRGTGLGSSSAFAVGLLHALHSYRHRYVSKEELGAESCHLEMSLCGERIGKQDQYAAAFGGLNFIRFHCDDRVSVEPIICDPAIRCELQTSIVAFYTGLTRSAASVLNRQTREIAGNRSKERLLGRMVELAGIFRDELQKNDLKSIGEILHENWMLKRELCVGISSPAIDTLYDIAREAGAAGGKLLGAGVGGFLIFYASPERHPDIAARLGLRRVDFRFEPEGSRVILYQQSSIPVRHATRVSKSWALAPAFVSDHPRR